MMRKGAVLTSEIVMEHCGDIGSTKRPQHGQIWPAVKEFPLTRVAKVDKLALQQIAAPIVERLCRERE